MPLMCPRAVRLAPFTFVLQTRCRAALSFRLTSQRFHWVILLSLISNSAATLHSLCVWFILHHNSNPKTIFQILFGSGRALATQFYIDLCMFSSEWRVQWVGSLGLFNIYPLAGQRPMTWNDFCCLFFYLTPTVCFLSVWPAASLTPGLLDFNHKYLLTNEKAREAKLWACSFQNIIFFFEPLDNVWYL